MQVDLESLINEYLTDKCHNFSYCSVTDDTVLITLYNGTHDLDLPSFNLLETLPNLLDKFIEFATNNTPGYSLNHIVDIILLQIRDNDPNTITGLKDYKTKVHQLALESILLNDTDNYSTIPYSYQHVKLVEINSELYAKREISFENGKQIHITNLRNGTFDVQYY